MSPHPFTNFEIQKHYQNEPKFYVVNLDEYESVGSHRIALYENVDNATYFDSFGVEYSLKKTKKLIGKKIL